MGTRRKQRAVFDRGAYRFDRDRTASLGGRVMLRALLAFLDEQSGVAHLQYALMLGLVTMGVLGSLETMGASVLDWFVSAADQLDKAANGP